MGLFDWFRKSAIEEPQPLRQHGSQLWIEVLPNHQINCRIDFGGGNISEQGDRLATVLHLLTNGDINNILCQSIEQAAARIGHRTVGQEVIKSLSRLSQELTDGSEIMDPEEVFAPPSNVPRGPR